MSAQQIFHTLPQEAGVRFDRFLADRMPGLSRSRIQAIIRDGGALLNGAVARASETVRLGDEILFQEPPPEPCDSASAEDIPLDILFEDSALVVLNKPAGMVVHPGAGNLHGTLVSALLHHCGSLSLIGGVERPGIVHRLDKETSGCLVVAKTDPAHRALSAQFADREVQKTYLALTAGVPRQRTGVIEAPIARHRVHRQKMAVSKTDRGRDAVTEYRVLGNKDGTSLIECRPRTGRTHQIRVHLQHIGCPILGDRLYGRRGDHERHLLHAWKLAFQHPVEGRPLTFEAPPPKEFLIFDF